MLKQILSQTANQTYIIKAVHICRKEENYDSAKKKKRRLKWFGHVMRMNHIRLPSTAMHRHEEESRCRGRQQDAQLSQTDRAAGCVIVFAKSRRAELGDNILRTL